MKLEKEIAQENFKSKKQKAIINLVYTSNWLNQKQTNFFKQFDLSVQQFNILRILRGQHPDPATIKLLKERMLDKMSDASRIVEKLRKKGLVERNECPSDRRNVDVCITDKGLKLLKKIDEREPELHSLTSNLKKEELEQLNNLLDKLRG